MPSTLFYSEIFSDSPLGNLEVICTDKGLVELVFGSNNTAEKPNQWTESTIKQLTEYFGGKRNQFSIPLEPKGTDFQRSVWNELNRIPFGKTITYEELANRLGDEKVIRAAASANGKNPIPVIIPCHRVIGKDGSLTGFSGGLWRKKKLLELEQGITQQKLF